MLTARDLTHRYGERTVLDIGLFTLPAGTTTALVGPNGSGKSTLLRILAGVEPPTAGTLWLGTGDAAAPTAPHALRRRATLVEQHPLLFDMTVEENLRDALRLRRDRRGDTGRRIRHALELLHADHLAARAARTLSGGETQRVALARALLLEPAILLLDEPLSAADRSARSALAAVLDRLGGGTTICLSSHQLEEAYRWSDRIFTLVDGRLEGVTPENLFRTVLPEGTGTRTVHVGPLSMSVVSEKSGPVLVALPPDDLIVSRMPLASSARNHFAGTVTAVSDDGRGRIRLVVDAGVDLVARITPESLRELEIHVGVPVVLSIKTMAVRVF